MESSTDQLQMNHVSRKKSAIAKLQVLLIVVLILFAGGYVLFANKKTTTKSQQAKTSDDKEAYFEKAKFEAYISITKTGFNPSTVSVKPYTAVYWKNTDSSKHKISLTPGSKTTKYWENTDLGPSGSYSALFIEVGEYHYYDADNPTANGVINVK